MVKELIFNTRGVEIYTISNFVSDVECEHLCNYIEKHSVRSSVAGHGKTAHTYSDTRTSSSTPFRGDDPIANLVDKRIAFEIGSVLSHAEPLSGHLYKEGEHFNDHTDYFDDASFINHCLSSGQRTWTVMIYLNEVEAGGHTEFPEIGKSFAPQKGTAVIWKNADGKGTENPATIHCGLPVLKGKKIILTKWFRENEFNPQEDERLSKMHHEQTGSINQDSSNQTFFVLDKFGNKVSVEQTNGMYRAAYKSKEDIPAITQEGFQKMPIPKPLYHRILSFYYEGMTQAQPEFDPEKDNAVREFISSEDVYYPTELIPLNTEMIEIIFDGLEEILSQWSGKMLARTYCYGIRTYKRGAVLKKHTDGFDTRIISAILNVDQKVDEPWALQIDDHEGIEHEIYLEPGEMVLYESAILSHGRVKPFKGESFTNIFVHYVHLN